LEVDLVTLGCQKLERLVLLRVETPIENVPHEWLSRVTGPQMISSGSTPSCLEHVAFCDLQWPFREVNSFDILKGLFDSDLLLVGKFRELPFGCQVKTMA